MRALASRALHQRLANLLYVRAAAEELPTELSGVADRVSVVLPWGSLLAAVARPVPKVLRGIRGLGRASARLDVLLSVDPLRDRAELARLGLASLLEAPATELAAALAAGYEQAGFRLEAVRTLQPAGLEAWPSTWARRLSHARGRTLLQVSAAAAPADGRKTASGLAPYNGSGGPS